MNPVVYVNPYEAFTDDYRAETVIVSMKPQSEDEVRLILREGGLSEYEVNVMIRIAYDESNFGYYDYGIENPFATGLYQILPMTWQDRSCEGDPLNYIDNTKCAIKIYRQYGFHAWAVY